VDDPSSLYYFLILCFAFVFFLIFRLSALHFLTREAIGKARGEKRTPSQVLLPDYILNGLFLIEVLLILLAADGFRRVLGVLMPGFPETVSFVLFAVVVFGLRGFARMLLPRSASQIIGAFTAPVVKLLGYALAPFAWLYSRFCRFVGILLRAERRSTAVSPSAEFFELYAGESGGDFEEEEKEMIEAIISIRDTRAREVMVPRVDIVAVSEKATINEIKGLVVKHGYSRLPVYRESVDDVVGILHAKDLFLVEQTGADIGSLLRKPYYVPDSKKINEILTELQEHKTQMAIVVDEYGGTAGLITLEDVIEEIVGEIHDEYDAEEFTFEKLPDGKYTVNAKMDLEELSEELGIELQTDKFETLGGFIIAREGQVPSAGEVLQYDNFEVKVLDSDERRISSVQITVKPSGEETGES
jgi:CBS domain containing-hemolysin-like protein